MGLRLPWQWGQCPSGAPRLVTDEAISTPAGAQTVLWLTNASHLINHFLGQMVSVLYPAIMAERRQPHGLFSRGQRAAPDRLQPAVGVFPAQARQHPRHELEYCRRG
jgi:hypothetical protein